MRIIADLGRHLHWQPSEIMALSIDDALFYHAEATAHYR